MNKIPRKIKKLIKKLIVMSERGTYHEREIALEKIETFKKKYGVMGAQIKDPSALVIGRVYIDYHKGKPMWTFKYIRPSRPGWIWIQYVSDDLKGIIKERNLADMGVEKYEFEGWNKSNKLMEAPFLFSQEEYA